MSLYSSTTSVFFDEQSGVCYRSLKFMGFSDYRIGDDGSLWSRKTRFGRRPCDPWGIGEWWKRKPPLRRLIILYNDAGQKCSMQLAHLVLFAFIGERPAGAMACHFPDRNTSNNDCTNLIWGTAKINASHRNIHGTHACGERQPSAVSKSQANRVKLLWESGHLFQREIAKAEGLSLATVKKICRGVHWTGV